MVDVDEAINEIISKAKDPYGSINEDTLREILRKELLEAYEVIRKLKERISELEEELAKVKEWGHKGFYANKDVIMEVLKHYHGNNITPRLLKEELEKRGVDIDHKKAFYLVKILEGKGYLKKVDRGLYAVQVPENEE